MVIVLQSLLQQLNSRLHGWLLDTSEIARILVSLAEDTASRRLKGLQQHGGITCNGSFNM